MSSVIELELLKPMNIDNDEMIKHFETIVKTYSASYFNMGDLPLLELYVRTYKELLTLYDALALTGSPVDEKNKRYENTSRLIDSKAKTLIKLGASLRINPQQRKAPPTARQDIPSDVGRKEKESTRQEVTHKEIWDDKDN